MSYENHLAAYNQVWHNAYATFEHYLQIHDPKMFERVQMDKLFNTGV